MMSAGSRMLSRLPRQPAARACRAPVLLALLLSFPGGPRAQQPQMDVQHRVPNLMGDSLPQAELALQEAGLTRGNVQGSQAPTAQVVRQSINAGTLVRPGASIALIMGLPQDSLPKAAASLVSVPTLDGLPRARAVSLLDAAGLRAGDMGGPVDGSVATQQPAAGSRVVPGTAVNLTFELRLKPVPELVTVPQLGGSTKVEATEKLKHAGLSLGNLDGPPDGRVNAQVPSAEEVVRRGTAVNLSMADGTPSPPPSGTLTTTLAAILLPGLVAVGWLTHKRMRSRAPEPAVTLVTRGGHRVYRPSPLHEPRIQLAFSLRDRMPPPRFRTAVAPRVARRQGDHP